MRRRLLRPIVILSVLALTTLVVYAAASYPSAVKSFTTKLAGQTISSSHVNDLQDEIVPAEGALLNGFAHLLKPSADNTDERGTSSLTWRDVYLRGTVKSALRPIVRPGGRLTLTSGTAVTTADVTAATTVYYTPYLGNQIPLYNGTDRWLIDTFSEISIAVPATTSTMYDLFIYDSSGTPTLEALAWTNDTTRATALTTQDGMLVKTGATTRLYVGSVRTTTVSGQTEDSTAKRYLWNDYNRVPRQLQKLYGDTNWTYTTATLRQANANAANQVEVVVGVAEVVVRLTLHAQALNNTGGMTTAIGIGYDSTSAMITDAGSANGHSSNFNTATYAHAVHVPAIGRHFYAGLEYSEAVGTTTWYGTTGAAGTFPTGLNSGLRGFLEG